MSKTLTAGQVEKSDNN